MTGTAQRRLRLIDAAGSGRAALRIAIATGKTGLVDATFGRATLFAVYDVERDTCQLVELIQFPRPPHTCSDAANDNPDDCEERVDARIRELAGCHVVFARRIGDVAAASAMKNNIHPIEVAKDEPITALLDRCRAMLAGNPPPWLRRIVGATPDIRERQDDAACDGDACAAPTCDDDSSIAKRTAR